MRKAIFIDKDGTLIENIPHNVNPTLIKLMPQVGQALKLFKEADYLIIVTTNQSGVAKGFFKPQALEGVKEKIASFLTPYGISFDDFYFCPHHPEGIIPEYSIHCSCRKPQPGMIIRAAYKYNIDLSKSWMIGDLLDDVEAGRKSGCKTILIDKGNETEWKISASRLPHFSVCSLSSATEIIISQNDYYLNLSP